MKHHRTYSSKMGETDNEGTARKRTSKKKGTDGERRKQAQKRKGVTQTVKRKNKEDEDYSPAGERGYSKKVKLTSAKTESWQTLSESSRMFLETVMDSGILSILCQQSGGKGDVQKHLNLLKERMLGLFKTLKVPPGKLGDLKNVLSLHLAEKQMLETNEKTLIQLQEEITEAEQSAEHMEETIMRLQNKIQALKKQLEEDEKKAQKVFQEGGTGALHLPELPKRSLQAPTLQEEILKIKNQKGLLKDMNTIQQSADMKNMLTLIEKIYEKVDFL
ncbi:centromere protein Q [Cygnus atratus]|uniref:centromere protein Q n=1 Tax=Cygnus atratus TaxID=8868 RepID=UPI0015D5EA9F|nr:centromere protein Q [Cygnus atratus]